MRRSSAIRGSVAAVAVVAVMMSMLAGCSSATAAVTVPVLWVSRSEGQLSGGVSSADITVKAAGDSSRYAVTVDAAGSSETGASWDAAAAMASAVSVLYSGQDPRGFEVDVTVSDAIDGSSAGSVLAVGVIAAMQKKSLRQHVAMTGTITPDGSVGHVDGIEAKVRAAAAAGYTTVVLPADSVTATDSSAAPTAATDTSAAPTTDTAADLLDAEALAQELGITITPVSTVGQAITIFTGDTVGYSNPTAPPLTAAAQATRVDQAAAAIAQLRTRITTDGAQVTADERATAEADLVRAQNQSDVGNTAGAYATAIGALVIFNQAVAEAVAATQIAATGSAAIAELLLADFQQTIDQAGATLATQSTTIAVTDPVRRYADIHAMGWLTQSIAVLQAVSAELQSTGGESGEQVQEAAAVLAQYRVVIDWIYPDSQAIAELTNSPSPVTDLDVTDFIGAYSDLLRTAAEANQDYYETVLTSIAANPDLTFAQPGHVYAAVQQLASVTAPESSTPTPIASAQTADQACAWALSYFLMSSYLVAVEQSLDLSDTGIGNLTITTANPLALSAALAVGTDTVAGFSTELSAAGMNTDHAVWTLDWGTALPSSFSDAPQQVAAQATAVTVTWGAATESFMNTAALQAAQRR